MSDFRRYTDLKAKGAATISTAGDMIVITKTNFDPDTGVQRPDTSREFRVSEIDQEETQLTKEMEEIQNRADREKANVQKQIDNLDEVRRDAGIPVPV